MFPIRRRLHPQRFQRNLDVGHKELGAELVAALRNQHTVGLEAAPGIQDTIVLGTGPPLDVSRGTTANSARLRDTPSTAAAAVGAGVSPAVWPKRPLAAA